MPERRKCLLNCPKLKGTTLYCFPKDEIRRQVWLGLIGMEYTSKVHTYLCARHFSERMFYNTRLKRQAVPDINLKYVDLPDPDDDDESIFECISFEDDTNSNMETAQSSKLANTTSALQKPKMVMLPKNLKIVPIKNAPSDPLFVPKTQVSPDSITKKQIKIMDGSAVTVNMHGAKKVHVEETTDTETAAVQPMIRIDSISNNARNMRLIKKIPKACKMRSPLAPLEMKLATRIWQTDILKSDTPQKLPTLKPKLKIPKLPVRSGLTITVKNRPILPKPPAPAQPIDKRVVSPAGPVRVKNIHELDDKWKEQAKKVAEQTENTKKQLAEEAVAKEQLKLSISAYTMDSSEMIIEEDVEMEDNRGFTIIEQPAEQKSPVNVQCEKSEILSISDSSNDSKPKKTVADLLCDEVLPMDDEELLKSNKKFDNCTLDIHSEPAMNVANEEIFVETTQPVSKTNSNILMMGIEDFKKIADDSPSFENYAYLSEGVQTGTDAKQPCGFIDKHSYNGTLCMSCFYCTAEFPLWDWQQFSDHIVDEHKEEMKPKSRMLGHDRHISMKIPIAHPLKSYPHYTSDDLDSLLNSANVQYVLVQGAEPNTVALMPLHHILGERTLPNQVMDSLRNFHNKANIENSDESDEDSLSSLSNEEFHRNTETISFKKTDPARVMQFLEILRQHPLLWHTRRHGPTLYDEEAEKFLTKFDKTMTPMNFRSSLDYLRHWYRRYTPPTSAIKAKLEVDTQRREYVEILSEIDELSKNFAFYCDRCPYYFLDKDRLDTHKYLKHNIGDLKYACSCGLRFADSNRKDAHELLHKPKPSFMCELCGMSFLFNRTLLNHMNTKHADVIEDPLPYKCPECDARFPNSQARSWHALKHAPPRFKCHICGQAYLKSFPYKMHMKKHIDQRDFVCEDCGKAFVEKRSLINHRYRVHKAGGYHCDHCDTYYSCYEKLFMHNQIRHPNGTNTERPKPKPRFKPGRERRKRSCCSLKPRVFKCKQCGTVFERQYQLMRHKRLLGHNMGERYFKCSNCSVMCKSRVALVRHLRTMHSLPITFGDIKEEDYYVPTFDTKPYEESELNDESELNNESEFAVQTITCTEEEQIIVQDEEIQEIFEEFNGDYKIEHVTSNNDVS